MRWLRRHGAVIGAVIWLWRGAAPGLAAQAGPPAASGESTLTATDPIRCWWRTDKSAVFVGERLALTLTCSVVDTPGVRVVTDQSRLDPGALQLPPFDVVEGVRPPDIQSGQRRFFQYDYSLRVVSPDLFGREVVIPALDVRYRVQMQGGAAPTVEGAEQTYRLPALPLHVTALVPQRSADIREAPGASLGEIQSRWFRGNIAFALAALLFSASLGCLAIAATAGVRRYRTPVDRMAPPLSDAGVLRSAVRELEAAKEAARVEGWTSGIIGRALAAMRVGLAIALGRRPQQTVLAPGMPGRDGAVIATSGMIRPKRVMVSASVTDNAIGEPASPMLDGFRSILATLTGARYSREGNARREQLDDAVDEAIALLRRLRAERSWRNSAPAAVRSAIAGRRPQVP
jgi:hypothetical protein